MKKYQLKTEELACLENLRAPLGVYQFLDSRIVALALSDGFVDLFGFDSRGEAYAVMEHDMYDRIHPDDISRIADAGYRFVAEGDKYEVVFRGRTRDESVCRIIHAIGERVDTDTGEWLAYIWYTDEGTYMMDDDTHTVEHGGVFQEALRRESMVQASYYDFLTGVPNMSYFFELVESGRKTMRQEAKTPAILFIDLGGMKRYNMKYGFTEGDKLLREIAGVLVRLFGVDNCSRFGQDHFAVLADTEGLEEKIEQIQSECEQANEKKSLPVRIGIYVETEEKVEASIACDRAKYACDSLKDTYTSCVAYYDEDVMKDMENQQYLIENLDRALKEHWIEVYYQPIVRAANGRVSDEEALARWVDPVQGVLPPNQFIPVLEDVKLIYKLDLYMVDQVLEKLKAQAAAGLFMVPQSVNLSRADFEACDIVEEIRRRVDDAGIQREMLTIELTESIIGSDFEFIREQVARFQELGFQVWMDDFSSGYSSLDVLQYIRFDTIKFDMHFMRDFGEREEGRIILTEMVRLAIGLGIDSLCEGVETEEQVEFLKEIGCTKLQGYYFCRPIPVEEIMERYRKGIQIGFENPQESEYFATIGRINLYDASVIASDDRESMKNYFNTIPMAIIETTEDEYVIARCNNTYRAFMKRMFEVEQIYRQSKYGEAPGPAGIGFLDAMRECGQTGNQMIIDEQMPDGTVIHALIKRVAVNPSTNKAALAVAVLAIMDQPTKNTGLSFMKIANALSSNYFDLFYVDVETEDFDQYRSNDQYGGLDMKRHGRDFFSASRRDAVQLLHPDDSDYFVRAFTKQNVVQAIDTRGAFILTYRQLIEDEYIYVNMKAVRMDERHIIIGVNNVNAQMQEKLAREELEEERVTLARISALSGDYIAIYTVDPGDDSYIEYSTTSAYESLNLAKAGNDFFEATRREVGEKIFPEDVDLVRTSLTKDNILRTIEENGVFRLRYRLMIEGKPKQVVLRAALVQEKNGPKLIVGVSDLESRQVVYRADR